MRIDCGCNAHTETLGTTTDTSRAPHSALWKTHQTPSLLSANHQLATVRGDVDQGYIVALTVGV